MVMLVLSRKSALWVYLDEDLKGLLQDGEILMDTSELHKGKISDFSYLVFPFAKAYEGFLKRLFLDLDVMREDEYYSDDIRIGRVLSPRYMEEHGELYNAICLHKKGGQSLADELWAVWKKGRNQVFHYFPHNFRSLSLNEALEIIHEILEVMQKSVASCELK
jgi:hypothetical protein